MSTVFAKILAGEISCDKVYEDKHVLAFKDIHPKAPIHILIIPKKEIRDLQSVKPEEMHLISAVVSAAQKIALDLGVTDGYRLVTNNGSKVGQTIFHLHFHLLAGAVMDNL